MTKYVVLPVEPESINVERWPKITGGMRTGVSSGVEVIHKDSPRRVGCNAHRSQAANRDEAIRGLSAMLSSPQPDVVVVEREKLEHWENECRFGDEEDVANEIKQLLEGAG